MRVLAHEQRFEAASLQLTRELIDGDAVIRGKVKDANAHGGSRNLAPHPRRRGPTYNMRPGRMSSQAGFPLPAATQRRREALPRSLYLAASGVRLPQLVARSIRTAMTGEVAICMAPSCG